MVSFTLIALASVSLSNTRSSVATAQTPDYIFYNGKKYSMFSNPLEEYFERYPEKNPKPPYTSSNLWRGYIATFEIRDGHLILNDIRVRKFIECPNEDRFEYYSAIDQLRPSGQVFALDWFSGLLTLPTGKQLNYVHMGYGSLYSNYILLEVTKGRLTGTRKYTARQYERFKFRQFQAFKQTKKYQEMAREIMDGGKSRDFADSFLFDFVIEYTTKFLD